MYPPYNCRGIPTRSQSPQWSQKGPRRNSTLDDGANRLSRGHLQASRGAARRRRRQPGRLRIQMSIYVSRRLSRFLRARGRPRRSSSPFARRPAAARFGSRKRGPGRAACPTALYRARAGNNTGNRDASRTRRTSRFPFAPSDAPAHAAARRPRRTAALRARAPAATRTALCSRICERGRRAGPGAQQRYQPSVAPARGGPAAAVAAAAASAAAAANVGAGAGAAAAGSPATAGRRARTLARSPASAAARQRRGGHRGAAAAPPPAARCPPAPGGRPCSARNGALRIGPPTASAAPRSSPDNNP